MLRIFANDHHSAFSLDDLALFAYFLYRRFNFHCIVTPFLLGSVGDTALGQIVNRYFYRNLVAGQYPNIAHSDLT